MTNAVSIKTIHMKVLVACQFDPRTTSGWGDGLSPNELLSSHVFLPAKLVLGDVVVVCMPCSGDPDVSSDLYVCNVLEPQLKHGSVGHERLPKPPCQTDTCESCAYCCRYPPSSGRDRLYRRPGELGVSVDWRR